MLDEFIIGGEVQESSQKSVISAIAQQDILQEVCSVLLLLLDYATCCYMVLSVGGTPCRLQGGKNRPAPFLGQSRTRRLNQVLSVLYLSMFLLHDADMHSAYLLRRRAGWVAGWAAVCPSHAGIVSKQPNLS